MLEARVGADIKDFLRKMGEVDRTLDRTGNQAEKTGGKVAGIGIKGAAIAGIFGLGAAAMGKGVSVAADFEEAMAEIAARTGITGKELQKISDFALDMGAKTKFSGQEAAEGLLQLLSSGQDVTEAMATLKPVMDLAAAGAVDLGRAADGVTDILAMFKLGARDSAMVSNVLARAAGASSATVEDLLQAFANVGPIAARYGMSVSDTAAALAVLAENGIKGAEAGTQIKSMLTNMDSKEAKAAMDKLGISLYNAAGEARPLNDVLGDLREKMATMTDEEKNALIKRLAGSYGQLGLSALLAASGLSPMTDKINAAADAATVADARTLTFKGTMEGFGGSLETLATKTLMPFVQNTLTPMVKGLTDLVNGVSEGDLTGIARGLSKIGEALLTIPVGVIDKLLQITGIKSLMTPGQTAGVAPFVKGGYGTGNTPGMTDAQLEAAKLALRGQGTTEGIVGEGYEVAWNNLTGMSLLESARINQAEDLANPLALIKERHRIEQMITDEYNKRHGIVVKERESVPGEVLGFQKERLGEAGIKPSELLLQIYEDGYKPSTSLQALELMGYLPSDSLKTLASMGFTANDSLLDLASKGLVSSEALEMLLKQGTDLTPEAKLLLYRGLVVQVQLNQGIQGGEVSSMIKGKRAAGGPVTGGEMYLVGERGPELFVPRTSGRIVANGGGGGSQTINLVLDGKVIYQTVLNERSRRNGRDF